VTEKPQIEFSKLPLKNADIKNLCRQSETCGRINPFTKVSLAIFDLAIYQA